MATPFNQAGQGTYNFGESATPTTGFSNDLVNVQIKTTRESVTKPATYGNNVIEERPGATQREITIEYLGDPSAADSFWSLLFDQIEDNGLLYFDVLFQDGAASATNKRHRGAAFVNDVTIGAPVNGIWQESVTYPVIEYSVTEA